MRTRRIQVRHLIFLFLPYRWIVHSIKTSLDVKMKKNRFHLDIQMYFSDVTSCLAMKQVVHSLPYNLISPRRNCTLQLLDRARKTENNSHSV